MLDIDGENIANTLPLHSTAGRKSPDLRLMPVKTQKVSAFNFSPEFEIHPSERGKKRVQFNLHYLGQKAANEKILLPPLFGHIKHRNHNLIIGNETDFLHGCLR